MSKNYTKNNAFSSKSKKIKKVNTNISNNKFFKTYFLNFEVFIL